jgi:hypothetical protein
LAGGIVDAGAVEIQFRDDFSNQTVEDVTVPSDPVVVANGVNDDDGDDGPPPGFEGPERAIDNVGQKYLNFLDLGSGVIVTPSIGPTVLTGLRLYPANDALDRDPASFRLEGSAVGPDGPFTLLAQGPVHLPLERISGGDANQIGVDPLPHRELRFSNTTAYVSYRLVFPELRDAAAANSMQIGEVEFLGYYGVPPAPPTAEDYRTSTGETFRVLVTGSTTAGAIRGTDTYTDDSVIAVAAVHAGLLAPGETGMVLLTILPGQSSYLGTLRNGVLSNGFGSGPGSYRLDSASDYVEPTSILRAGTILTVTYQDGDRLQQTDDLDHPWEDVTNAVPPYVIPLSGDQQFFRTAPGLAPPP